MPYHLIGISRDITGVPAYTKKIVAEFTNQTLIDDYLNNISKSSDDRYGVYPPESLLSGYLGYEISFSGTYDINP